MRRLTLTSALLLAGVCAALAAPSLPNMSILRVTREDSAR